MQYFRGRKQITHEFTDWSVAKEKIEWSKKEKIGEGTFATVYKANCGSNIVAIKIPKKELKRESSAQIKAEIEMLGKGSHPNICQIMGVVQRHNRTNIITEFLPTNLSQIMESKSWIPLSKRIKWIIEITKGIAWLHGLDPPIIHRDIKPSNIMLDFDEHAKVCDLGLSHFQIDSLDLQNEDLFRGTALYAAPEVLEGELDPTKRGNVTIAADVYSIGIVLWELITHKCPFDHMKKKSKIFHAKVVEGERPSVKKWLYPNSLHHILDKCWNGNPNLRPTAEDLVQELIECLPDCEQYDFEYYIDESLSFIPDTNREITPSVRKEQQQQTKWAREFWKREFRMTLSVELEFFIDRLTFVLREECGNDLRTALKYLLDPKKTGSVTPEKFQNLLDYCGMLDIDNPAAFFARILDMHQCEAIHVGVTTFSAEDQLSGKSNCFLLRPSNSKRGLFCVTYNARGGIGHRTLTVEYTWNRSQSLLDILTKFNKEEMNLPLEHFLPKMQLPNSKIKSKYVLSFAN